MEAKFAPDKQLHGVFNGHFAVLVHKPVEKDLMGLLVKEGTQGLLSLEVEGPHDVGALKVLVFALHHVDHVVDLFFLVHGHLSLPSKHNDND